MRRDLITVERSSLLHMRNRGKAPVGVIRRVERDLDLDEARLRG
jgi:hypothetical protein